MDWTTSDAESFVGPDEQNWEAALYWREDYPALPDAPASATLAIKVSAFRQGDFQFAVLTSSPVSRLEAMGREAVKEVKRRVASSDWESGNDYILEAASEVSASNDVQFVELDALKAKLDALRPLDPTQIGAVEEKFRLEWTYNSNAIEGNPLTLSETSFFLREGLTSKGKPLSAFLEAQNHLEAIEYLRDIINSQLPLSERVIKDLHAILFKGTDFILVGPADAPVKKRIQAGAYKTENNHVITADGSIHWYTEPLQVPGEMEGLLRWHNSALDDMHPVTLAAMFHHGLVAIHPFDDGNGRVSRLCMNLILMRNDYSPAILKVEDRQEYYGALEAADSGVYAPFVAIVEREVTNTIQLMLDVIEGREAFDMRDIDRLVSNVAASVRAVETELGRHARSLGELRAELFGLVGQYVEAALAEHITGQQTKDLPFSIQSSGGAGPVSQKLTQISGGSVQFQEFTGIQISSNKRIIPLSVLSFAISASKYKAKIFSAYAFAELDERGNDNWQGAAMSMEGPSGSIYAEDWDEHDVKNFVLESLKNFYWEFERQVARRREVVTSEELGQ